MHSEYQYLKLVKSIIRSGFKEKTRNGHTYTKIGETMRFSLNNNTIPLITTKKLAWKTCLRELLWFVTGDTNNENLQKKNVKIWNGNASREFLDSRNLHHLRENDLGPVYGHQWRFFNAKYVDCDTDYTNKGVDQLEYIINSIKTNDTESKRRLIMSAWNPCQINEMALPPCHVLCQFHVNDNKLSCSLYQRSGDVGLGIPFNIASYSFLTHLIAHHCDLEANEFIHFVGNAHIYDSHVEELEAQLNNIPFDFPKLYLKNKYDTIDEYVENDFIVENYISHDKIHMDMRV
tara:strand:- start:329 stop:1198 length:870 start_codon:yes stop_codon:yes gene_type:complete